MSGGSIKKNSGFKVQFCLFFILNLKLIRVLLTPNKCACIQRPDYDSYTEEARLIKVVSAVTPLRDLVCLV